MYASRYGGMGSMGMGGYGMSGMGMGMGGYGYGSGGGYGGYGGSGMGLNGYGSTLNMGMGSMGLNSTMGNGMNGYGANIGVTSVDGDHAAGQLVAQPQAPLDKKQLEAQQKAQVAERKRQRRLFIVEATMQIVSGVMQVVMQLVMGLRDIAGIAIGVYYSYHTIRSFRSTITGHPHHSELAQYGYLDAYGNPNFAPQAQPAVSNGGGGSSVVRALKVLFGAAAIYSVTQSAVRVYQTARAQQAMREEEERRRERIREIKMSRKRTARRVERARERALQGETQSALTDSDSSSCSSCSSSDFGSEDDELLYASLGVSEPRGRKRHHKPDAGVAGVEPSQTSRERKVYVALFDHEATGQGGDFVSFRAGDQFEIEDYNNNAWCDGVKLGGDANDQRRILIPGNYLKPLQLQQKF